MQSHISGINSPRMEKELAQKRRNTNLGLFLF